VLSRPLIAQLAAISITLVLAAAATAQPRTYLALGDSYGFGYETGAIEEFGVGDRGYVKPYADWLSSQPGFGSVRPKVVNISVPAETTASYFNTSQIGAIYNTNYPFFGRTSQSAKLASTITAEVGAGRTISHVSISMGGNDLLSLRSDATFAGADLATQQARVTSALATMVTNYQQILSQVRSLLPSAELLVVGYFNPFPAAPSSPFAPISGIAISELNTRIMQLATGANARFIDIAPRFVGHEAEWSYITAAPTGDNIHPNATGYAQIAQAMIPAPAVGVVFVFGGAVIVRRRRAA
jgi:lysophospholipase L1-like esterase